MTKILILFTVLALNYNIAVAESRLSAPSRSLSFITSRPSRSESVCVGGCRLRQEESTNHFQRSIIRRRRQPLPQLQATKDTVDDKIWTKIWTMEDLDAFALSEGVELSKSTIGPGFRTVARSTHNSSKILGYGEGFVRPSGDILHLDKMEVFKKMITQVRAENPDFRGGGTVFGVGLLFGYQCLIHGVENGCRVAEFLAIDDEDFQHKRLVRFYKQSGFKVIKYVGEDFRDIPDRMVWGGCGTLMRANIDDLLPLWTMLLSRSSKK